MVDVEIEFEGGLRPYKMGEAIRGHVVVTSGAAFKCNVLEVKIVGEFIGGSVKEEETFSSTVLTRGEIPAGTHRFEFECVSPKEHFTYFGERISCQIDLVAHLDLSWAVDKKAHATLNILPQALITPEPATPQEISLSQPYGERIEQLKHSSIAIFLGGLAAAGIVSFMYPGNLAVIKWGLPALVLSLTAIATLSQAFKMMDMKVSAGTIKDIALSFDSYPLELGERRMTLALTAARDLVINEVKVELVPWESLRIPNDKYSKGFHHDLKRDVQSVSTSVPLAHGQTYTLPVVLSCPAKMPTMQSGGFKTYWQVNVYVDIVDCPDFEHKQSVEVRAPYVNPDAAW